MQIEIMSYIEKPRDFETPRSESTTCWVQDRSAPGAGGVEPRGGDLLLLGLVKVDGQFSTFSFELQTKQTDPMVQNQSSLFFKKGSRQDSRNGRSSRGRWFEVV